jgi:peptide deformylase
MVPSLLPDNHPMLSRVMPEYDFDAPNAKAEARTLARVLIEAMVHHRGIGLAANQIGIEHRAFAIELACGERLALFNPLVTWVSTQTARMTEGCLTFDLIELSITRPSEVQVAYNDAHGERKVLDLKGIDARCALHECDHLEGILFTQRVSKLRLSLARKKIRKKA